MQSPSYASRFGISQSMIKDWRKLPPLYWKKIWVDKTIQRKNKKSFLFGSLTDCIALTPGLLETYFTSVKFTLPSDTIKAIIDQLFSLHTATSRTLGNKITTQPPLLDQLGDELYEISRQPDINYGKGNFTRERIIKDVIAKGSEYYYGLREAGGRSLVTFEMNMQAVELAELLKHHPRTRKYFTAKEGTELFYQQEIFIPVSPYPGYSFFVNNKMEEHILYRKAALDILLVDHIAHTGKS